MILISDFIVILYFTTPHVMRNNLKIVQDKERMIEL